MRSTPPAAQVFVDGELAAETPARLSLPRESDHSVFLKKEGFRPELVLVYSNRSPDGLAFLVPHEIDVRLVPLDDASRDLKLETDE